MNMKVSNQNTSMINSDWQAKDVANTSVAKEASSNQTLDDNVIYQFTNSFDERYIGKAPNAHIKTQALQAGENGVIADTPPGAAAKYYNYYQAEIVMYKGKTYVYDHHSNQYHQLTNMPDIQTKSQHDLEAIFDPLYNTSKVVEKVVNVIEIIQAQMTKINAEIENIKLITSMLNALIHAASEQRGKPDTNITNTIDQMYDILQSTHQPTKVAHIKIFNLKEFLEMTTDGKAYHDKTKNDITIWQGEAYIYDSESQTYKKSDLYIPDTLDNDEQLTVFYNLVATSPDAVKNVILGIKHSFEMPILR